MSNERRRACARVEQLTRLRLRYVANRLDAVLNDAARIEPTALDFLDGVLRLEVEAKQRTRVAILGRSPVNAFCNRLAATSRVRKRYKNTTMSEHDHTSGRSPRTKVLTDVERRVYGQIASVDTGACEHG